ncbi:MAG: exodeoxyribonuclease III [Dehalococcoidia bacterium]|nr:exodeoxyribonuclease III [Dehalococcoidia bacterium]
MRLSSWNINGIRHAVGTGDLGDWLASSAPDIAGFQEVKAAPEQCHDRPWLDLGYHEWWHPAERSGYSGILLLAKTEPDEVRRGLQVDEYDREGRLIEATFGRLSVLTTYFPNGQKKNVRVPFKLAFIETFFARIEALRRMGQSVVFMGDLNVAHTDDDLERPAEAAGNTGVLPEERAWLDRFVEAEYVDTFRHLHPESTQSYTFWDPWRNRRERNIGWRIDYVFVSSDLLPHLRDAFIEPAVMGSDHCPVGIDLELPRDITRSGA